MTDPASFPRPQWLEYPLAGGFRAFSTRRAGGVGTAAYATMNLTHYCGDDPAAVAENRRRLCAGLGIGADRLVLPRQTHGTDSLVVDRAFLALDATERDRRLDAVDAVLTDVPGVCIGVSTADCIPVLVADPVRRAAAAIHAGWRGMAAGIVPLALGRLTGELGCRPDDLRAVVGPGIGPEAFEVGDEVYDAFSRAGFDMEHIAFRRGAKWHIDLPAAAFLQLEAAGLPLDGIMMSGICTYSQPDEFFSARRLGLRSGRIFNGILML